MLLQLKLYGDEKYGSRAFPEAPLFERTRCRLVQKRVSATLDYAHFLYSSRGIYFNLEQDGPFLSTAPRSQGIYGFYLFHDIALCVEPCSPCSVGLLLFIDEGAGEGVPLAFSCGTTACFDEAVPSCAESVRDSPLGWVAGFVFSGSEVFGFTAFSSFLTSFWFPPMF